MAEIGEIKRAWEVGRQGEISWYKWCACELCGKERWVRLVGNKIRNKHCQSCGVKMTLKKRYNARPLNKGGRKLTGKGYILIKLEPDDFFYQMARENHYVLEHRLVVARALGRCLHRWEIVHHKHAKYPAGSIKDKQDNRYPENLQLVTDDRHKQITILENRISGLENKVEEQTKHIKLLQWQVKELTINSQSKRVY